IIVRLLACGTRNKLRPAFSKRARGMDHRRAVIFLLALVTLLAASPISAQVTSVIVPSLPSLGTEDKDAKDPDAIYCRPPLNQTDTRLPGPRTCRTNRAWDELHAQGLDNGSD